jgi:zinc protease
MHIDRTRRPSGSKEINFIVPKIQFSQLHNGLKISFSKKDDLPIIRINFLINSGSKYDPENYKGLSNLLAMCVDEGAGELSALQLADKFEMLGAQFSVSSDPDIIIVSLQVLKENFREGLKLFASVLTAPHLSDNDFNREKKKVITRLEQVKAEPDYLANSSFDYFLFGNESPYAFPILGIERTVKNIQLQQISSNYKKRFLPSNSSIIIVGNLEWESLQSELSQVFDGWGGELFSSESIFTSKKSHRKVIIVNKPKSFQTEIRIGHLSAKRNQKDFFQKQLLNLVLGGQFSSRLNLNLREKHGYTYGINSRFNYLQEAGYFTVSTSVDVEKTSSALKEIFYELNHIKDGITSDELNFAKSSMLKRFPSNFETYRQIAGNLTSKIIHKLPNNYFETYIDNLNLVSLDSVNQIAQSSINLEQLVTILVGDSKLILKQLSGTDLGQIQNLDFDEVFNN